MSKDKDVKVTPVSGMSMPKGKHWCQGQIWFDENGCLHIEDKDLGTAVINHYLESGKLCISVKSDFSPSNNLNIQCAC